MARIVVHVMPKPEILDPQGQAVHRALGRIGITGVTDVRQGKRFEITHDGTLSDADVEKLSRDLLANTVIEDFDIVVEREGEGA